MKRIRIAHTFIICLLVLTAQSGSSMDFTAGVIDKLKPDLDRVYGPFPDSQESIMGIFESFQRIDAVLNNWPNGMPRPSKLVKALGAAIGQFCYGSPYTLQAIEGSILPYLNRGELRYEDCRTPNYEYKFGLRDNFSRTTMSPAILSNMKNGQTISTRYHLNYPVLFNRFLSEFKGDSLLIGGGEICECEDAHSRHPKDQFFTVDIDIEHKPDMIAHASYLPHLYSFPSERFSFIWFEHCSIPEFMYMHDKRVAEQYFRISKPGSIFLYQTFFIMPDPEVRESISKAISGAVEVFESLHFTI